MVLFPGTFSRMLGAELYFEVDGVLFCLEQGVDVETWSRCLNLESMFELGVEV